jgi:hypothetical protein
MQYATIYRFCKFMTQSVRCLNDDGPKAPKFRGFTGRPDPGRSHGLAAVTFEIEARMIAPEPELEDL